MHIKRARMKLKLMEFRSCGFYSKRSHILGSKFAISQKIEIVNRKQDRVANRESLSIILMIIKRFSFC